jgi:3-phosphoshikimate 1-carboxyvinyltransferase
VPFVGYVSDDFFDTTAFFHCGIFMELKTIKSLSPGTTVNATLTVPSSKSLTHRALIIAAFSADATDKAALVESPLESDDTLYTLAGLHKLGYVSDVHEEDRRIEYVVFSGKRAERTSAATIDIHHSGTSARLLTAVTAAQTLEYPVTLDGSPRMRQRPMAELLAPLTELGAEIQSTGGFLPLHFTRGIRQGGHVRVDAAKSSQFLSALLLIAPLLDGETIIETTGAIASKSYSDMTIAQMRLAEVEIGEETVPDGGFRYTIPGGQHYKLHHYVVEGDYSAASYALAAAAITRGEVHIPNLTPNSAQGDRAIIQILQAFGNDVLLSNTGVTVRGAQRLRGIDWDMNSCPDIVPTVAVLALFAESPTILNNIGHLQYKESDRLSVIINNIKRLGGKTHSDGETLIIEPAIRSLRGTTIPTHDDHRMAMAFALVGLRVPGVIIENPLCVAKSYPDFWRDFERLYLR